MATLADAKAFVLDTACAECGWEACSTTRCDGCGVYGCRCLVAEPVHGGGMFCPDCTPECFGRCCTDD